MTRPDPERAWLSFANSAVSGLSSIDALASDYALAREASRIADAMMIEYLGRYGDGEIADDAGRGGDMVSTPSSGVDHGT